MRWLALGALAGLLAAGYGILRQNSSAVALPTSAIAKVNDVVISRDNFDRTLDRYAVSNSDGTLPERQAAVLESLINDELLLQRGLELGMAQSDLTVRAAIINSLVASVTAEADAANPTDEELQKYLADNADRFSYTAKIAVEAWQTDDEAIAQSFARQQRNEGDAPSVAGLSAIPDIPRVLMPLETLRNYLGPGITAAVVSMPTGSSSVFARRGRWVVVRVSGKETSASTNLDTIRNRVLLDYRRNLADRQLDKYLKDLRNRAAVQVALP